MCVYSLIVLGGGNKCRFHPNLVQTSLKTFPCHVLKLIGSFLVTVRPKRTITTQNAVYKSSTSRSFVTDVKYQLLKSGDAQKVKFRVLGFTSDTNLPIAFFPPLLLRVFIGIFGSTSYIYLRFSPTCKTDVDPHGRSSVNVIFHTHTPNYQDWLSGNPSFMIIYYMEKPKWYYSDWQYLPSWFLYLFIFMSTVYSIAYEHYPTLHQNFSAPSGISLRENK